MILLDNRVGSRDLIKWLPDIATLDRLEFADAVWEGKGMDNEGNEQPVLVGVERKNIPDLCSSIDTGRFTGHQAPGMLVVYDVCYLIVEGHLRATREGMLKTFKRGCRERNWGEVINFLDGVELRLGFHVRFSANAGETALFLRHCHNSWQKPWHSHKSHLAVKEGKVGSPKGGGVVEFLSPKRLLVMKMAAQVDGIGSKAREISKKFDTPLEMAMAGKEEWMGIKGIGKGLAERMVEAMQGAER